MPRSVNAVASRRRRKKVMNLAKGYWGSRSKVYTIAKNTKKKNKQKKNNNKKTKKKKNKKKTKENKEKKKKKKTLSIKDYLSYDENAYIILN